MFPKVLGCFLVFGNKAVNLNRRQLELSMSAPRAGIGYKIGINQVRDRRIGIVLPLVEDWLPIEELFKLQIKPCYSVQQRLLNSYFNARFLFNCLYFHSCFSGYCLLHFLQVFYMATSPE